MTRELNCSDAGFDCEAVIRADSDDEVMAQARAAGARITKEPHDTFWGGYAGYFQDPDGHLWEIMWNPALDVKD